MSEVTDRLMAISPLDGRYAERLAPLATRVSEYGLIRYRLSVETGWLATLGSGILPDREPLSGRALDYLYDLPGQFSVDQAAEVKEIEATTKHDVKAVEVWLQRHLSDQEGFNDYLSMVHFGATSEDINNLAYALMIGDVHRHEIKPHLGEIEVELTERSRAYRDIPMLGHTHGQPATPTTMGKEMAVFRGRLISHAKRLGSISMKGKFNGATGNYNALDLAYPEVHWPAVCEDFVRQLGFEFNPVTTQIEPHDWMAAYFNELALGNRALTDLVSDMWLYIAMGYFGQKVVASEVGSSTMPNKVNPIDFENAESNFTSANAILKGLADKLPVSRLQRDLSDSSSQRTIGSAFGHTIVGYTSTLRGLGKIFPNEAKMAADLESDWGVLAEGIQTVMRRYGDSGAYDKLKQVSRGKSLAEPDYLRLVYGLDIPAAAKDKLMLSVRPSSYLGYAKVLSA